MASLNKVQIIGFLGQDPEMRFTTNGDPVCNLNVATSETWKDKSTGEKRESTEWHRVVIFGKPAEVAAKYLRKGSQLYVEGKIVSKKFTDKEGIERVSFNIQSENFKMFGKPETNSAPAKTSKPSKPQQQTDDFDEDYIPF